MSKGTKLGILIISLTLAGVITPPAYFQKALAIVAVVIAGIAWIEVDELKKKKGG